MENVEKETPASVPERRVRRLVLDTGAFISGGDALFTGGGVREVGAAGKIGDILSDDIPCELYTVDDVVDEIRDNRARRRLKLLQDNLQIKTPSQDAIATVVRFAKSTGDFASLSLADIKVIALTFMMEVEQNGEKFVKDVPLKPKFHARKLLTLEEYDALEAARTTNSGKDEVREEKKISQEGRDDGDTLDGWESVKTKGYIVSVQREKKREKNRRRQQRRREKRRAEKEGTAHESIQSAGQTISNDDIPDEKQASEKCVELTTAEVGQANDTETEGDLNEPSIGDTSADALDNTEWITKENVNEHLAKDRLGSFAYDDQVFRVGCVTNDFAMQNVLLQMGVKLLSVDGRGVVKKVKRFVLQCESCNSQTQEVERKFCPDCGNATLFRVAYTIDRKGIARTHINAKHTPRLRGTKYSIPMPRGGRRNKDLILCEDQIDPQKLRRMAKAKERGARDVLDPNSLYNAGARYDPVKPVIVGYGRRNPNVVRTKRKGKK